ncbi:MAG: outer membrane protein [Gemmatimonadota bacterium]
MKLTWLVALLALLWSAAAAAQEAGEPALAPPPSGITPSEPAYALGVGVGVLTWDDDAPYEGVTLASVGIERRLWQAIRGRARLGLGETELLGEGNTDVTVILVDLELLASPVFGPLRDSPILPYVVGGLGAVVTDPSGEGDADPATHSQSQWSVGAGVRVRPLSRWEIEVEGVRNGMRLLDPLVAENPDSETIHNLRWEGRLSWTF